MNKKLFLTLLFISITLTAFTWSNNIDKISGNIISSAGFASSASLIVAYFIAAALILGIAIIHLLNAYGNGTKKSKSDSKHKILSSKTASVSVGLHPHKIFDTNIKNFLRPEKIIVISVAIVAFISIIVMLV